ncbi:MAG: PAS domain S-box protein [Planctomycetes bacterium]|nr:PAS domain S-box protein [Planctomycetota bacterium]
MHESKRTTTRRQNRHPVARAWWIAAAIGVAVLLAAVPLPRFVSAAAFAGLALAAVAWPRSRPTTRGGAMDLVDATPVPTWGTGPDGRVQFCNRAFHECTGGAADGAAEESFAAALHPEERDSVLAQLVRCAATRSEWTGEFRMWHREGRHRWMSGTARPHVDPTGAFLGLVGGCVDIDERRRAAAAEAEAHARLQVFVDHAAAAVAMFDKDMRYLACSRRWLSDYGLENETILGRNHYDVFPEIPDRWKEIHRRCLQGAVEMSSADRFERADGRCQWLRWDVRPWRAVDGSIGGLMMFTDDITAALEAARLRETTATVMEAIAADRALPEVLAMLTAAAEQTYGDLRASVLLLRDGKLWLGAGPSLPPDYNAAIEGIAIGPAVGSCGTAAFTGRRVIVADTWVDAKWDVCRDLARRHDLRACWSQPIVAGGSQPGAGARVLGTFAMYFRTPREPTPPQIRLVEDLAHLAAVAIERCRASEALHATMRDLVAARRQAEAASLAKSEFLANMSHEIRTPMSAILGFADILADEPLAPLLPRQRQEALAAIRRNGDHLIAVINDVLDISKIEAGKMSVERIATDARQVVDDVVSQLRERAEAKGLAVQVVHADDVPRSFLADPLRLRQILVNLLGNAIKFTDSGSVTVATALAPGPDGAPWLRVNVIDTGIGMSPAQCVSVFDAFTQADTSTTRRFGGTGLGLRISKRLAEVLGGDIAVESELGRGSVFTLRVPAPPVPDGEALPAAAPAAVPARDDARPSLAGARILLAEDGRDNQRLLTLLLRRAGADVTIAENGRAALAAMCEGSDPTAALRSPQPFDLVLMDMQMPELDGYAAATMLREKGFSAPVIAITAHALAGDRERCIAAGCDDYLRKPVDRVALVEACVRAMDRGRQSGS